MDQQTWAQEDFLQGNMLDYDAYYILLVKAGIGIPERERTEHFQTSFEPDDVLEAFAFVHVPMEVQVVEVVGRHHSYRYLLHLRRSLDNTKFVREGIDNTKRFGRMFDLNLRWMFVDAFDVVLEVLVFSRY